MENEIVIAAIVGYFLAKIMEWAKGSAWITWLNPDTTGLIQFLTASVSIGASLVTAWALGKPLDLGGAGLVIFHGLLTWIAAEITYHKTLKMS